MPPPAADCPSLVDLPGPKIVSPEAGARYSNAGLARAQQGLALSAQSSADVDKLYWYVDGYLVAEGGPESTQFWAPSPGVHEASVLDSRGRSHAVTFKVEGPAAP
jgi:membrane carboxypeptidase/penicillin-binding protein PbpC